MAKMGAWLAAPVNEPWCVSWLSHFLGHHAPGLRDIRATARAMHHILLGHGRSLEVMRELGVKNLGAICNFEYAQAIDASPGAAIAAKRYDAIYNRFFLSGLLHGQYPEEVLEGLGPHMPAQWQDDMELISRPLDWLGLNYYTRKIIAPSAGPWPHYEESHGDLPKTEMGWEIYPEGLLHFLKMVTNDFSADLPLYVTENGMASAAKRDHDRIAFLNAHLAQARSAIAQGINLKGFYIWSLLDNYEWALGYGKRFGIVEVDFDTGTRSPKASFHALTRALKQL